MIICLNLENTNYGIQEVSGSIPLISTRKSPEIVSFQDFFFAFGLKMRTGGAYGVFVPGKESLLDISGDI